jgi:hypothetical protein
MFLCELCHSPEHIADVLGDSSVKLPAELGQQQAAQLSVWRTLQLGQRPYDVGNTAWAEVLTAMQLQPQQQLLQQLPKLVLLCCCCC